MNRKQRGFLNTLKVLLIVLGTTVSLSATGKPNIVAIIADDHGVCHSTAYGSPEQKSPRMQSLWLPPALTLCTRILV